MSKTYPAIPETAPTLEGAIDAIRALKQAVELLTGVIQPNGSLGAPRVFVQYSAPPSADVGDLWIDQNNNSKLNYWGGDKWYATT